MKSSLLVLVLLPIFAITQIHVQHVDNDCPESDILRVCVENYPYAGLYAYETTVNWCGEEKTVTGTANMIVNMRGQYYVPDFSFGAWAECFNDTEGTLGTVEMRAECSFIIGIFGTDRFGEIWSSDNFAFEGNSVSFNWFNTYGDFGLTTLTPIDGRILNDPTQIIEDEYDIIWSTGETEATIFTNNTGLFQVTITDPDGVSESTTINLPHNPPSIHEDCGGEILEVSYFLDENENGIQDDQEVSLNTGDYYISLSPSEKLRGFNGDKFERFVLEPGTHALSFVNKNFEATNLPNEINILEGSGVNSLVLGLKTIENVSSIDVNITTEAIERCNWIVPYTVRIQNDGTLPYNDELTLTIDPSIEIISSSVVPIKHVDNTITFLIDIEYPTQIEYITLYLKLPGSELLGEILCISTSVETLEKSYNDYCFELLCAHDPNDKHGTPFRGDINPVLFGESLEYTIRFENLGNDTAFNIKVRDYLEVNYDIRSFRMLHSSHPITRYWIDNDRVLNVEFDNIKLPSIEQDTTQNKGFFQFTIDPLPALPEGTTIKNKASIFFDQNDAIITNTTSHTLVSEIQTTSVNDNTNVEYKIWPNPARSNVQVDFFDNTFVKEVTIYNTFGYPVYSNELIESHIDVSKLVAGIYYVSLTLKNESKIVKRLIKI